MVITVNHLLAVTDYQSGCASPENGSIRFYQNCNIVPISCSVSVLFNKQQDYVRIFQFLKIRNGFTLLVKNAKVKEVTHSFIDKLMIIRIGRTHYTQTIIKEFTYMLQLFKQSRFVIHVFFTSPITENMGWKTQLNNRIIQPGLLFFR